jgi:hypothetical protein
MDAGLAPLWAAMLGLAGAWALPSPLTSAALLWAATSSSMALESWRAI